MTSTEPTLSNSAFDAAQATRSGSRASLARVIEDLGSTLVELAAPGADPSLEVAEIVIFDPHDHFEPRPRALVLGVGVRGGDAISTLIRRTAEVGGIGLVVKLEGPLEPELADLAAQSQVTVLGLLDGVSWNQLAAMLRSITAEGSIRVGAAETGPPRDLFALANALTALLDAPVTIEDRSSRVIAFSERQDEADEARIQSILDRQVPARFTRRYESDGVFRALYRSTVPVFIQADPLDPDDTALSRIAIAVRAGEEILGSIWVAVRENLEPVRLRALEDAANLVALEMMKLRAGEHVERRLRADLVATVIGGGSQAPVAADRLALHGLPVSVVAIELRTEENDRQPDSAARLIAGRERVGDALAMHLSAVSGGSVAAVIGDLCVGLVVAHGTDDDAELSVLRLVEGFLERVSSPYRLIAGIGFATGDVRGIEASFHEAERAVRALRARGKDRVAARLSDVQADSLVIELADRVAARGERPHGPVARLAAYDARNDSHLVETFAAWLEHFGDIPSAAKAVYTHPNTFRYRLKRVAEIGEIDLTNPGDRFAAMLHLRLWPQGSRLPRSI